MVYSSKIVKRLYSISTLSYLSTQYMVSVTAISVTVHKAHALFELASAGQHVLAKLSMSILLYRPMFKLNLTTLTPSSLTNL